MLLLSPSEIVVREEQNVRKWSELNPEHEIEKLQSLATSMRDRSQLQPVVVRQEPDGSFSLIAGHRRRRAAEMLPGFKLKAIVLPVDDDQAYRSALAENLQRENLSPLDLAMEIQHIRASHDWMEDSDTKRVADFLAVSRATVTQHEKLLQSGDGELQSKVHSGAISMQAALELLGTLPEKRKEVLREAEQIADQEEQTKRTMATSKAKAGRKSKPWVPDFISKKSKPKVTAKHVRQAARKSGSLAKSKQLRREEILEIFGELADKTWPKWMQEFAAYFSGPYASGKGSDKQLIGLWRRIALLLESPKISTKSRPKHAHKSPKPVRHAAKQGKPRRTARVRAASKR